MATILIVDDDRALREGLADKDPAIREHTAHTLGVIGPPAKSLSNQLLRVCGEDKDTHLFLGNIFSHQHIFTIVGLWFPKKRTHRQRSLFS